jgi:mannose-6-phosphate isomerase-like protein (cupin superfamily)
MPLERKKTLNVFNDAREAWGSYDDFPVGQPGTDPMPHLSRNRVAQPFYLVSEADQVLIQMAGHGEILFRDAAAGESMATSRFALEPGDTVYIPACVPSRLIPYGENVQVRLKAEPAVREAVAWYCACGALVASFELAPGIMQERYLSAVHAFNAGTRRCPACDRVHPPAELGDINWAATSAAVRASL